MAEIREHTGGIRKVGALIRALEKFPGDMPITVDGGEVIEVFLMSPEEGEEFEDERGEVRIGADYGIHDVE